MGPFIAGARSDCLLVLQGGHPSENIDRWTVSGCVCVRECVCMSRPALIEKLQMPLCVYICLCVCVVPVCLFGRKGNETGSQCAKVTDLGKEEGEFY